MKIKKTLFIIVLTLLLLLVGCEAIKPETTVTYSIDKSQVPEEIAMDKFDLSCIKIKISYSNGKEAIVDVTESMISETDLAKLNTEGTHLINVKYKDLDQVVRIVLTEASQETQTTYILDTTKLKEEYVINEFKLDDLTIVATHEHGDKETIKVTKDMLSKEDQEKLQKEGTHTITINYDSLVQKITIKLCKNDIFVLPDDTVEISFINALDIKQNETTTIKYKTSGTVNEIIDEENGKISIKNNNDLITISNLKNTDGIEYKQLEVKPEKGDKVLVEGFVKNDNGEYIIIEAKLINLEKAEESSQNYIDDARYYAKAVGLEGTELMLALRQITTSGYKGVSYSSLNTYLAKTDVSPNDPNKILLFYTRREISNVWDSGKTWNKEHVWPRSTGWFGYEAAGCDAHHIRAVDSGENSRRGNKAYGTGSGQYLPTNNVKGDVARIIFYLLVRYQESDSYKITAVAQSMNMLLEWNRLDPVDDIERKRNEEVYKIQNNRNPFIDNSDYAYYIWDTSFLVKTANNTNDIKTDGIVKVYCIIDNKKGRKGLFCFYINCIN